MSWALEVEVTHTDRLVNIIRCILGYEESIQVQKNYSNNSVGVSDLIFTSCNILLDKRFPYECFKYVSRVFFVPYSCRDTEWMLSHQAIRTLLSSHNKSKVVLKIICYPKELEPLLGSMLFDEQLRGCNRVELHPTKHSHVVMCIFDAADGIFRWGILQKDQLDINLMTSERLSDELQKRRKVEFASMAVEPVCRAFYKLDEIIGLLMPNWGWSIPSREGYKQGTIGLDIGASPGGWTQRLAPHCDAVLSIDPGLLRPEVMGMDNVYHLQYLVQAEEVQQVLRAVQSTESTSITIPVPDPALGFKVLHTTGAQKIRFVVCDINCDAAMTADFLCSFVLPYLEGYGICGCICQQQNDAEVVVVVTLKLFKNPKPEVIIRSSKEMLTKFDSTYLKQNCGSCCWDWDWGNYHQPDWTGGKDCKLVHLCANSTNERTLLMRRRCHRKREIS